MGTQRRCRGISVMGSVSEGKQEGRVAELIIKNKKSKLILKTRELTFCHFIVLAK